MLYDISNVVLALSSVSTNGITYRDTRSLRRDRCNKTQSAIYTLLKAWQWNYSPSHLRLGTSYT